MVSSPLPSMGMPNLADTAGTAAATAALVSHASHLLSGTPDAIHDAAWCGR